MQHFGARPCKGIDKWEKGAKWATLNSVKENVIIQN